MKVILLKDVKKMGRAHEVIEVADGHALNYLLPQKLATAATPAALKDAELRRTQAVAKREVDAKLLAQNIASLAEARIVVKAKVNEKGHLYDAIGAPEIVAAAKEQAHIDLPQEAVKLEKPIKDVGVYEIPVAAGDGFGKFSVTIEAE